MRRLMIAMALSLSTSPLLADCPMPAPSNWCSGSYLYDGAGNIKAIGSDWYVYDLFGRLVKGTADIQRSGVFSIQNYTYDAFGNRTSVSRDGGSVDCDGGCQLPVTIDAGTNHITSNNATYDEAGNLTAIDSALYTYDAAGSLTRARATSADDRQYIYTADDERIATGYGVSWTWTVRGLDEKVLSEYTSEATSGLPTGNRYWLKDYVWRDGLLVAATIASSPGSLSSFVQHYHLDHLGTARVVSDGAGRQVGVHAYYAFGAELTLTPNEPSGELMKFTGHERDIVATDAHSLDYMHARYGMATLGRFLSVDKHELWRLQDGDDEDKQKFRAFLARPQGWNRYTYALNNPIEYTDPDGKDATLAIGGAWWLSGSTGGSAAAGGTTAVVGTTGALVVGAAGVGYAIGTGINHIPGVSEAITSGIVSLLDNTIHLAQNNKQTQNAVGGLLVAALIHLDKIGTAGGPGKDPDFNHHKGEIKAFLDRALRLAQRLPKGAYEKILQQVQEIGSQVGLKY